MFWADKVAEDLKKRKLPLEWMDDMKTPSGRIHVGSLRGVVVHDLVYKTLKFLGVNAKYTYVFDDHDPMDALPVYLSKEKFEKYLGMPLYKIPSPVSGFESYAEYYAQEFIDAFNAIGCNPKILWATDLYLSGKMNSLIKKCLDKADVIRGIYEELYKRKLSNDWFPFQVFCRNCGKVSTTRVSGWDGDKVSFVCEVERLKWTKGCGFEGAVSPFSNKDGIAGKLPWKVEWACKWKAIGVTVEGAGKDHMSRGGSHDLASLVCKRVLNYPIPYPIAYEFFLVGGKKMSSSKGLGSSSAEMLKILPPELLRFLMVKTRLNQAINFDPTDPPTIPKLFDEYQKAGDAYYNLMLRIRHSGKRSQVPSGTWRSASRISNVVRDSGQARMTDNEDLARIFELSQVGKLKYPPTLRFQNLTQWVQMPNMESKIKETGLEEWVKYARVWVEKYAPESEKFLVQEKLPNQAKKLSEKQKSFLKKVTEELSEDWDASDFQKNLYEWAKELDLSSKEAFAAIYLALIGKDHGPKAAWLILSLDRKFVNKRFEEIGFVSLRGMHQTVRPVAISEIASSSVSRRTPRNDKLARLNKPEIFSIDQRLKEKFPSVSIGIAIIKGVTIKKSDPSLEKEKQKLLQSLQNLTTEQLGQYPEIQSYRKLYKATGIDWHSRRPSPEAFLRRVALNKGLYTINTCVDAYNLVVMKHRVSIGAFDLDKIEFPTILRFTKKGEEILLLGDNEPTGYKEGEIAYFDKIGGYNIDFNYRDAQRTAVQLTTKNLYINVDGVYEITPSQVEKSLQEACDMIIKYCGGTIELFGVENAS